MKNNKDNIELLELMESKQRILLKLKVAIALDRMDLVEGLSCELRTVFEKEHSLCGKQK